VLGGQEWNAISIDHEMQQVSVKTNDSGMAPKWKAVGSYDIPFELAQEVGRLLMNDEKPGFLEKAAQIVLQRQRNMNNQLGWQNDTWVLESSSEDDSVFLWTFAGDKINRALSMLLSSLGDGKPEYDFKSITLKGKKGELLHIGQVREMITHMRSFTMQQVEVLIYDKIPLTWFSKFSECLPESLAKKALQEKVADLEGLVREWNRVRFHVIENSDEITADKD
jgi:ATP-dependent Lhr-like helicase